MWRLFLTDLTSACSATGLPAFPVPVPLPPSHPPLPPPTPLLYGVSEAVFPRQPFWPESVQLCGYWQLSEQWLPSLSDELVQLVGQLSPPLLYIGFGSMESFLKTDSWLHAIAVIDEGEEDTVIKTASLVKSGDHRPYPIIVQLMYTYSVL